MAIKTLAGVTKIGGYDVRHSIADKNQLAHRRDIGFVEVCGNAHTITFQLQDGPVKEGGVNGCQVDTILEAVVLMIEGLNAAPHNVMENDKAVLHIKEALLWLDKRKRDREKRDVEGTSKP